MTQKVVHSPTSDLVAPWPMSPDHPGPETRLPLFGETKHAPVVQLNHMKDLRARVEQTYGVGPQQAPHSSSSASEALQMGPGSAGPQQAPHCSSLASGAPGFDIRVPPLKLPARGADAPQAGGMDYDVADVTGEVTRVGKVTGGMRAGVSTTTPQSTEYTSSSTHLVPCLSTQAGEHRADRKRANNQHEMPSSALPQVTAGPWGGRRWIPPSSRHPRRAQVLACSRLSCLSPSCSPRA